ncbi:hypothetical protein D3C85_1190630 [compost metagenome]
MVIQLTVAGVGRLFTAIVDDRRAAITLTQFHTMAIELVVLQSDGLIQLGTTLTTEFAFGIQLAQAGPAFFFALSWFETQSVGNRQHVAHAGHRSVYDLSADRLTFRVVAVQQARAGLTL